VENIKNSGIQNIEGVAFTSQRKQEMASLLKERMKTEQYFFLFWSLYLFLISIWNPSFYE
jgi:hypothetical protein